jgi:hypothetical protein
VIAPDFPPIFAEFRQKRFTLLWRGSRDGFRAGVFHNRCDRHANTLTVILAANGSTFGGFTPLAWESREKQGNGNNLSKADPSLRSFVFTLKNPYTLPARRFALMAEKKDCAIRCNTEWGPTFGGGDIVIDGNCNANTDSVTFLGLSYTNDTGLNGLDLLAGSPMFQVREIEVFEITA